MSGSYYGELTRAEYENGKDLRLYAEGLKEQNWYLARGVGPDAKELGAYALEALVILVALKPIDDVHEVQVEILDEDGRSVGEGETLMHHDGFLRPPDMPEEEGYFVAYPGNFAGSDISIGQKVLLYQAAH